MPVAAHTENEGAFMRFSDSDNSRKETSRSGQPEKTMADKPSTKLSPSSTKARSLPSTPSQRSQSPPRNRPSPITSGPTRERSPAYRRGMICKYETGMKQARRRVPYTLGPEKLDADPEGAAKKLSPKEEFRLTTGMRSLYQNLVPTEQSEDKRCRLVQKLERLLQERWPGQHIKVSVFGSTGNKLGTGDSDVDICITTDCKEIEHVCWIADLLARNGMERVVCVSSAKVPIVKVWDPDLQVACDMNVNNPIALENTELIRSYVAIDDRFRPLAMIIKYWAKRRILNDAALGGTLSSYTWICLVLNFLQTRSPPILPALQRARGLKPHLLNGVNVAFDKDLSKYKNFGQANTTSLGELLFGFFHYYGHELDFEKSVISVRLGEVVEKSQKAWHMLQDNRLCVEEPFNISRNLGNTADDTSVRGIHLELRRACDLVAAGRLDACCEQYVPPQADTAPRRTETFIQPTTKAIIPQPPPQVQPPVPKQGRNNYSKNKRGERLNNTGRRASNPASRPANHLRDLPFQMTPQELQLQAQHQQHLLHDQLFQQYQYLQMQEQELRLQLYRHRGLVAAGGSNNGFSGNESTDDGQESTISSRTNASTRMPMTAPLYQARFNNSHFLPTGVSSGIVTNPASPLLATAIPDSRRYARRASVNNAAANTLRAQSQPARGIPHSATLPYLTQRFDVPVRQVDALGTRRSSNASNANDSLSNFLPGRMSSQGTRYDAGRRPVEYVGYYVGQSPSLSAYAGSATTSPMPSSAGLAIHNGGLSPRLSTRNSRLPSGANSPALHYVSTANGANGTHVMTPVTENALAAPLHRSHTPPLHRSGPLVVDGSINSLPRRQPATRPVRSSSEEPELSVTTSEDAALDTPSSRDDMSNNGSMRPEMIDGITTKHLNGELLQERDFLSLNGTSANFMDPQSLDDAESATLRRVEEEQNIHQLTNALAAATVSTSHPSSMVGRHPLTLPSAAVPPLLPVTNGSQEWQTQTKRKKKNKKGPKSDMQVIASAGGEVPPQNEEMRKGG